MLNRTALQNIMEQSYRDDTYGFEPVEKLKEKQIKNSIKHYAQDCRPEDVIGICDFTVFGSGKNGYLLAADGLYGKDFSLFSHDENPNQLDMAVNGAGERDPAEIHDKSGNLKVPFEGIRKVELDKYNKKFLNIYYLDGFVFGIYVGELGVRGAYAVDLLERIAKASRNERKKHRDTMLELTDRQKEFIRTFLSDGTFKLPYEAEELIADGGLAEFEKTMDALREEIYDKQAEDGEDEFIDVYFEEYCTPDEDKWHFCTLADVLEEAERCWEEIQDMNR